MRQQVKISKSNQVGTFQTRIYILLLFCQCNIYLTSSRRQFSTERREQVNFQINQNEILLSLSVIQEEFRMELTLQINNTQTQILCSQYIAEISLSRVNEHEQEETDQRVMTLFPALNLEALRVAADTLVPRFIPAIPKMKEVTKITSEVNNVSSSAELTQVV
ncbi:Hypothetical_protein [Hexamita inflata]|uniref:Hypothetical_protein n=1 Tax=Hexamita inflata TaxID=28002 RepID=A0AA86RJP5_9EUKA|nr:Hypothetical protein HINF_LOCUS63718 [Hexamita inflata]